MNRLNVIVEDNRLPTSVTIPTILARLEELNERNFTTLLEKLAFFRPNPIRIRETPNF